MLWFSELSNVTFFDPNTLKIQAAFFNEKLKKKPEIKSSKIQDIKLVEDSVFCIYTPSGIFKITPYKIVKTDSFKIEGKLYMDGEKISFYKEEKFHQKKIIDLIRINNWALFFQQQINDSLILFSYQEKLYKYNSRNQSSQLIKNFSFKITSIIKINQKIIFSTRIKGLHIYDVNKNEVKQLFNGQFENKHISDMIVDREGGMWVSSLTEGVLYIPNIELNYIDDDHIHLNPVKKVVSDNEYVYSSTYKSTISKIKNKKIVCQKFYNQEFSDISFGKDRELYMSARGMGIRSVFGNKIICENRGPRKILFFDDNTFMALYRTGVYINCFEDVNENIRDSKAISRRNNEIFIGSESGVWKYDVLTKQYSNLIAQYPELRENMRSISSFGKVDVFCSISGVYVKKGEEIIKLKKGEDLLGDFFNDAFLDSDSILWIAGNKGVNKVEYLFDQKKRNVKVINSADGLNSDMIFSFTELNDTIYVGTSLGLNYFHKKIEIKDPLPQIFIDSINCNFNDVDKIYEVPSNQKIVRVNFHGASNKLKTLKYQYRVLPNDTHWVTTTDKFILLNALSSGNYTIEIKACDTEGIYYSNVEKIILFVETPLHLKGWFIFLIISLIVAILLIVFKIRIKQINDKQKLKNELYEIRQQALNSQMNPHFIFNSLNSIQNYLFDNDLKSSNKYLSQFSKLMRQTLDNSRKKMITLEEELEMLSLYLSLEKLRFKEKLSYSIDIEKVSDMDHFYIPPLLLQPFVENAIWHGIMQKETNGQLNIEVIQPNDDSIRCIIDDDGIGREHSLTLQNKNKIKHKSAGLELTKKRIEIVKELYKKKIAFEFIDKKDAQGNSLGTQVIFEIEKIQA